MTDIRVLELGTLIAGPFCGQLFGDMGAEVIKIEPPGTGDPMRAWGRGLPVWWPVIARNKKSVTLNLREPRGQDLLKQLVAQADVLIENFRPGTLEKWGLDFEGLSAVNERLVMVRVSGFGQTGPYARRAGYGSVGEAMGGIRYLAGDPDRPPSRVGLSIGDSLAATFACVGALAALHDRERSGKGQVVDSAIYEAVLAVMESTVPEYTQGGTIRERSGAILPKTAPSNVYPTADGEMIVMGANQDSVFARLAEAMGQPGLATDPRYADHVARGEHQDELDDAIAHWTATLEADALLDTPRTAWRALRAHLPHAGDARRPALPGPQCHHRRGASGVRAAQDAERVPEDVAHPGDGALAGARTRGAQRRGLQGPARSFRGGTRRARGGGDCLRKSVSPVYAPRKRIAANSNVAVATCAPTIRTVSAERCRASSAMISAFTAARSDFVASSSLAVATVDAVGALTPTPSNHSPASARARPRLPRR